MQPESPLPIVRLSKNQQQSGPWLTAANFLVPVPGREFGPVVSSNRGVIDRADPPLRGFTGLPTYHFFARKPGSAVLSSTRPTDRGPERWSILITVSCR
jgi:hypothetical protein